MIIVFARAETLVVEEDSVQLNAVRQSASHFPWLSVVALLIVLLSIVGMILVLVLFDKAIAYLLLKYIPPNVIPSIFGSFARIMMTVAAGSGIETAQWHCAFKGATMIMPAPFLEFQHQSSLALPTFEVLQCHGTRGLHAQDVHYR